MYVCVFLCLWIYYFLIINWCVSLCYSVVMQTFYSEDIISISYYWLKSSLFQFFSSLFFSSLCLTCQDHTAISHAFLCYSAHWCEHAVWYTHTQLHIIIEHIKHMVLNLKWTHSKWNPVCCGPITTKFKNHLIMMIWSIVKNHLREPWPSCTSVQVCPNKGILSECRNLFLNVFLHNGELCTFYFQIEFLKLPPSIVK